jgi:hypothetical protein
MLRNKFCDIIDLSVYNDPAIALLVVFNDFGPSELLEFLGN